MNNRIIRALASLAITLLLMIIIVMLTSEDNPNRLLVMLGGIMPLGIIQGATFFLFIFGLFEIFYVRNQFIKETDSFKAGFLPEKENWVLSPDDVNEIKLRIIKHEKNSKYLLTDVIKKCCIKYRLNKSSSEALELLESQVKIYQLKSDGEQSLIKYVAWAIPSVGFIGTVIGIAGSLGLANEANTPEGIKAVTDMLAVAFDTTLVALILSLVLMYAIYSLQEREDTYFANLSSYVIENLINRLYKS